MFERLLKTLLLIFTTTGMGISRYLKTEEKDKLSFCVEIPGKEAYENEIQKKLLYVLENKDDKMVAVHRMIQYIKDETTEEGYRYIEQVNEFVLSEKSMRQWKKAMHKYGVKYEDRVVLNNLANKEYMEYARFLQRFFNRLER